MYILYSYYTYDDAQLKSASRNFDSLYDVLVFVKEAAKYSSSLYMVYHIVEVESTKFIKEVCIWDRDTEEFRTIWSSNAAASGVEETYTPQAFFNILAFGIPAMDCSNNTREIVKAGLRFMAENFAQIAVAYNNQLKEKSNG